MRLILCGGGHVSLEVAYVAARLEFDVVVIDDRAEFASKERFPMAAEVRCQPFTAALDQLGSRPDDYYVILTRGHSFDGDCLDKVLEGQYAYVGMIGSRVKVAAVMKRMLAKGHTQEELDGVHTPIGLKIGAQTPAEIAISILAEIIQVRAQLGPDLVPPPEEPGVLVTITKKSGSAPRGEGTWMHVRPNGETVGTVGGGAVEYKATQDALALWNSTEEKAHRLYDLSQGAAAELGMVCGGRVEMDLVVKGR